MFKRSIPLVGLFASPAFIAALVAGCSQGDGGGAQRAGQVDYTGVVTLPAASALPPCNPSNRGAVYYVQSTAQFFYCDGSNYQTLNLKGNDGKDGTSWAVQTTTASPSECPNGGTVISIGPDANKDGIPDTGSSSTTVCNGTAGPQGPAGHNSLVNTTDEPAGANCAAGGMRVDVGLDLNDDGVLQSTEIQKTKYLCNGTSGTTTAPFIAKSISAASHYSCALLSGGTVLCWGQNYQGQLGDGTATDRSVPVTVIGITNAVAVVSGGAHSCALLGGGMVQCWGYNKYGQLGNGTTKDSSVPVTVNGF